MTWKSAFAEVNKQMKLSIKVLLKAALPIEE